MPVTDAQADTPPARRIAHLDMDAFYASVELLRYPELRGLPVVIGGSRAQQPLPLADGGRRFARLRDYAGRGVITTATYEARALGVFSAMGIMKAAKLAPDAILLPVDFPAYRHYSRLFKAAVAQLAPHIEDRGIDEIYIDLSTLADDSRHSRSASRTRCARPPGCRARSASQPTSCSPKSAPTSTSRTA
jgi:DNA polymerase-4